MAGDDWSASIRGAILPGDRAWAWWTCTEVDRSTKLPTTSARDEIDPGTLDGVVARRSRLDGMTLAFVPARDSASQETVAYWAGSDVEKIPDHLWTGPDAPTWDSDAIVSWCYGAAQWSDPTTAPLQRAKRTVTLFDNQSWACPASAAAVANARLQRACNLLGALDHRRPPQYAYPRPVKTR